MTKEPYPEPADLNSTEKMPTRSSSSWFIGPYRILEKIGEGGMGEVYVAEQTAPIRRRVALKVIKLGMDTKEVIARFEAERQALALMDHRFIAKVYEAGATERGQPFFAMEHISGLPITRYCDHHRLNPAERLRLFIRVCEGVQHAHQKAIIHRDLKPSNVLVSTEEGNPVPKIIDFGVAKALSQRLTEQTVHTRLGQLVGTPAYMSPEQAERAGEDIDTRTDVYSLGTILYELLVGHRPFDSEELRGLEADEIRRRIREEDPPRPSARLSSLGPASTEVAKRRRTEVSTLKRQLQTDLDWIVMKALEKDRSRRYGSPMELAADLRNYLQGRPVIARPPTLPYRARKFVSRYRVGVGIGALLLVFLTSLTVMTAIHGQRVTRERDRANQEAEIAEEVSRFLAQLFEISDPRESRGNSITAREILDRGAERIRESEWSDPRIQSRLLSIMGNVYESLGLGDAAHPLYEEALALNEALLGHDAPATWASRYEVGTSHLARGEYESAETILRAVVEAQIRILGTDDPQTARSAHELAHLLRNTGRDEEAETLYLQALASRRATLGEEDPATANTMNQLGILYWSRGRYEEAEPLLEESLAMAQTKLGPDHPSTLTYLNNMANFQHTASHWPEVEPHRVQAEGLYRECLDAQKRVLGPEHPETLRTLNNLGSLLVDQGKLEEAVPILEECVKGRRRALGETHRATLLTQLNLAQTLRFQNRNREAEALLIQILGRQREVLDPFHREIRFTLGEKLALLEGEERREEAHSVMEELLEIYHHDAERSGASAEELNRYAWSLLTCDFEDLRDHPKGLEYALAANQASDHQNPRHLRSLARAHALTGSPEEACAVARKALDLVPKSQADRLEYEEDLSRYEREAGRNRSGG